ncbi:stage II sporulation protein M [Ramlibacter tataouinensis]|uniref:Candidate membrane protein n=1 Tax=Ramlibacter tataouinensis (strain ATCC BAA-407 / DSM 14655 / LMG 21543 / TTB310) TaxID=365046 RepID=F5XY00_RAMTT|nr:stage II sporulation protein M [Ramlibacter tataouinensis]AEG94325.1 candidate membrane protein [Ramlibacter tataouinensis TTB310]
MTTARQFEAMYAATWAALERLLDEAEGGAKHYDGAALATLYRRSCEHLALARARAYPIHLTQRLESLTERAHRQIYRPQGFALGQLRDFALVDFPQAVRAHRGYLLVAAALFLLPMLALAWASWRDPGFILHLLDARQVRQFDAMYGPGPGGIGRERPADTDWEMFGFYIMNNIGIGFQCFAAGIFAGVGSAFYLVFNGLFIGAVGGYLITRGHAENFLSFVATHSAFELTAIVLAGAAGLRLGHAVLAPGRLGRLAALQHGARDAVVVVYGAAALLVVAAAVEAFWSSARWVAPAVKYGVAAACWLLVIGYLAWQGRPEDARAG